MKARIILFLLAMVVWSMLNWPPDWQHLMVGVVVSALVAYITGDMFIQRTYLFTHPERYIWFFYYIPVLIWEMAKANIDVAYRVIHPNLPIRPGIVKVKTTLKSDTGLTFLANSITLTPGTLTVDVDKEKGVLYIHWINVTTKDVEAATQRIIKRFEDILKRIFE